MPRAADGIPDEQALIERPAVMCAGRTDGEDFLAAAREQNGLEPDMPEQHLAICKLARSKPPDRSGPLGAGFPWLMNRVSQL